MPRRETEDIPGRIDVPVMGDTAFHAFPVSYSQPIDAAWPAERATRRTGAGGVAFSHFLEYDAYVSAFICQHRFNWPHPSSH